MSYLTERASYLRGLMEGAELDLSTKEGKILKAVIELVGDMSDEIEALSDTVEELQDLVDEIDEALEDVEEDMYGECDCDECDDDDDDWDFDEDDELTVECPHCGDTIYLDASLLENRENSITCPNCKEEIEIEFTDDECDCDGEHE